MKIQITQKQESTSVNNELNFLNKMQKVLQKVYGIEKAWVYEGDDQVQANWLGDTLVIIGLEEDEHIVITLHYGDHSVQTEKNISKIPDVKGLEFILDRLLSELLEQLN